MKKNALFALMAVVPLMVLSCAKEVSVETPEMPQEERQTMIDPWTAIDQSAYIQKLFGESSSVVAGFLETKSHISLDGDYAKVLWDNGDGFEMLTKSGGTWYGTDFSTTESGEKVTFTGGGLPSNDKYYSIYAPLSDKGGDPVNHFLIPGDPTFGFGLNLPAEQTAVGGGITKGLNFSFAQSDDFDDDLTFRNILALVRFKMTGSIASSVTSVTLRGATALAGDFVMAPAADGTPVSTFARSFGGDVSSMTVTLSGTFAADTYSYFAVVPGTQTSFSLVFSNGVGTTTKIASKTVNFARGQISDLGTIDLGAAFSDTDDNSTIMFMSATAGAPKPVTIAVIPDGFIQAEMRSYEMLAKSAMNTLFSVEPFKSYKEYFNVYIFRQPSNESGAKITDGTDEEKNRDCYFGSGWAKNSYSNMAADDDKIFNYVTNNCPDIKDDHYHTIDEVPVLVIINDSRYGGINWTYTSGRAYCMAPYTFNGGRISWGYPDLEAVSDSDPAEGVQATPAGRLTEVGSNVGNWLNTMVHEFGGHCFSRLADEYWYDTDEGATDHITGYNYPVPFGLNVSATYTNPGKDDTFSQAGWKHLLDNKATLTATNPLYNRIGVYQGGDVSILNRWRSERVSCMIDNRFYFSTFQRELIVKRIMTLAGASFNESEFWAKDVPIDPVRDIIASPVMGEDDGIPPRPMPMLPPPRIVEGSPRR